MNDLINRKAVTKVKNYLNKFDENIELIVLDETARTAIDAANSLKTEVGSIVKSLLFKDHNNHHYYNLKIFFHPLRINNYLHHA